MFLETQTAQAIKNNFTQEQISKLTDEQKVKIALAFASGEVEKFMSFTCKILTNPSFKRDFSDLVLVKIKDNIGA